MDVTCLYWGDRPSNTAALFYTEGIELRLRRRLRPNWVELEGASVPIFLDLVFLTDHETSQDHGRCISTS